MNKNYVRSDKRKHHIVYKTTCSVTGNFYIGAHSTDELEDGYLGSGRRLKNSINKHGKELHTRLILEACESRKALIESEKKWIEESYDDPRCMNLTKGGEGVTGAAFGAVVTNGTISTRMSYDDPRVLSGEFVSINKGRKGHKKMAGYCVVRDSEGKVFRIPKDDPRIGSELTPIASGSIVVKDSNGNCFRVQVNDPRIVSGELTSAHKGLVQVRDSEGNVSKVQKDDPRYLSGELKSCNAGKLLAKNRDGEFFSVTRDDPRYLSGELIPARKKWPE